MLEISTAGEAASAADAFGFPEATPHAGIRLVNAEALCWMASRGGNSIHALVTDPPYGWREYESADHDKLRAGKGGVWRQPPTLDGVRRSPLPRFTVLTPQDRVQLVRFFTELGRQALRILVPGGHLIIASNPLLSTATFAALEAAGLEKRGELVRIVKTMRGGDRPKNAEDEFPGVSVMPRAGWEPWGLFRKPIAEKTVAANLRRWGTGGFMRTADDEPFWDLFECAPASKAERAIAPHPSIKPQKLMRHLVRAALPLGRGIVYDPFAGSGSTLAAAAAVGYEAIGTERDRDYFVMGAAAVPKLATLQLR